MDAFCAVHLICGFFLTGNQGFIRATEFMGLVAQLLKKGQPVFFFFNFEHWFRCPKIKTVVPKGGQKAYYKQTC